MSSYSASQLNNSKLQKFNRLPDISKNGQGRFGRLSIFDSMHPLKRRTPPSMSRQIFSAPESCLLILCEGQACNPNVKVALLWCQKSKYNQYCFCQRITWCVLTQWAHYLLSLQHIIIDHSLPVSWGKYEAYRKTQKTLTIELLWDHLICVSWVCIFSFLGYVSVVFPSKIDIWQR